MEAMTPPTPDIAVSEERVKELRESVRTGRVIISGDAKDLSTLINIVEGYSSLRAENELLREDFEYKNEQLGSALIRVEKAEAELERLKEDCDRTADVVVEQMAQLAKQAPLIEAVMGADEEKVTRTWMLMRSPSEHDARQILRAATFLRAALALREEKK
jgi:hypothetical protein